MRTALVAIVLLVVASAFAEEGEARRKFLEGWRDRFAHSEVAAADTVGPENDFERAKGEAKWFFLLPFAEDERIRVIEGTVKNGKFAKGVMHTFGFKEEKITTLRFNKLRQTFPMIARRTSGVKSIKKDGKTLPPKIVVHPPLTRPLVYKAPVHPDGINLDPCSYAIGFLRGGARSVGADLSKFAYQVTLDGPGGVKVVLGTGTADKAIPCKTSVAAIRKAMETKWPERVGAVSDSDVVEFYSKSTVTLTGVK